MRTHENLEVWKKEVDFVVDIYKATEKQRNLFPERKSMG